MKRMFIGILFLLGVALATNPSNEDHRNALQDEIYKIEGLKQGFVTDALSYAAFRQFTSVKSYYLFSFTEIQGVKVGFGAFGKVWIFTDKLINKL